MKCFKCKSDLEHLCSSEFHKYKKKITIITGLLGSGKTTYAKHHNYYFYAYLLDQPSNFSDIKKIVWAYNEIVIVFSPQLFLIFEKQLKEEFKEHDLKFIYFENNPMQCIENMINEKSNCSLNVKRTIKRIINFESSIYKIPEGQKVLLVYRPYKRDILIELDEPLTIRSEIENWWRIERLNHENIYSELWTKEGITYCYNSARLDPFTCVEGDTDEILSIAYAIENNENKYHKRCAIEIINDKFAFYSPRNSNGRKVLVPKNYALDLAKEIKEKLK